MESLVSEIKFGQELLLLDIGVDGLTSMLDTDIG